MKTKKIISWAVALCMGMMLHSCDLDQKVFSSLTNANFPQTVEDIDALVVGMYANFKANSGGMWDDSNGGWAMPIYAAGDGWWLIRNLLRTNAAIRATAYTISTGQVPGTRS